MSLVESGVWTYMLLHLNWTDGRGFLVSCGTTTDFKQSYSAGETMTNHLFKVVLLMFSEFTHQKGSHTFSEETGTGLLRLQPCDRLWPQRLKTFQFIVCRLGLSPYVCWYFIVVIWRIMIYICVAVLLLFPQSAAVWVHSHVMRFSLWR